MAPEYYAEELKHTAHFMHKDDVYPTHIGGSTAVLVYYLQAELTAA
jgi:hypothetical protein